MKRGVRPGQNNDPVKFGLPVRPFLWSLDQISVIIDLDEKYLNSNAMVHYEGRSIGFASRHQLLARNIAMPEDKPVWRVAEHEFIRWLKMKGFRYYDRGTLTH